MRITGSDLQGKSTLRGIAFRRALFALPVAAALLISHAAADDTATSAKTATVQKTSGRPHSRAEAAKPVAAQPQPAPALPPVEAPKPPDWPVNDQPKQATVTWNSQGLRIEAANSSLQQILKDVATATGATLSGLGADQRIFGSYGPGPARDVISQLLDGSGYNVLMIGDQGQGTPRQIVLSKPPAGPKPQVVGGSSNDDNGGNADVEEPPPPQPQPPPQQPQQPPLNSPNGFGPGGQPQPRTPQQILQEMQQRQQQIEQQQQQQQNNPQ